MTETSSIPPTSTLMDIMGFTKVDLEANQQGNLSSAQADKLKRSRQRNTIIGAVLFFVFVIVATVMIFLGQQNENSILSLVGAVLAMINAIMIGMIGRSYMRTSVDLRDGNVEMLEGELERIVRPGRQQDSYLLRIDDASLYVTKDVFIQFRHEATYRLYRSRISGVLLSAEPLAK
jgi:hypothetical protein